MKPFEIAWLGADRLRVSDKKSFFQGHMIHFATTLSELSQQMSYDYPVEIGRKYSIVTEQKLIAGEEGSYFKPTYAFLSITSKT